MPNQKRHLSIFSFKMKRRFHLYLLAFFIPILFGYGLVEITCRNLPSGYKNASRYLTEHQQHIEVLAFGSSQMKDALNPVFMQTSTLNLASGDQHHDTDFKLYKSISKRLPNLKTVILEVSYSHFELPHNGNDFWKNSVYLNYYDVNCFNRPVWIKDQLLFLSNPHFFSAQLVNNYVTHETSSGFNQFGFDTLNFEGRFKNLAYDEARITKSNFKINKTPNLEIFKINSDLFIEMLETISNDGYEIIVVTIPMYTAYLPARNPEILHRRDSLLTLIGERIPNVSILNLEEDTLHFNVKHYWNQSHLNPNGAKVFTQLLQKQLDELN